MKPVILITAAVGYVVAVIVIAPFFMPPEYHWLSNTISELASQGVQNQWIMQAGFIGFGLLLNAGFLMKFREAGRVIVFPEVLLMLWGLSVLITGFFSAAPFIDGVPYSEVNAALHSTFATIAGIALTLGVISALITASTPRKRVFHLVFLLLITGVSGLFGLAEGGTLPIGKGLVQRVLWMVSFAWLLLAQWFPDPN